MRLKLDPLSPLGVSVVEKKETRSVAVGAAQKLKDIKDVVGTPADGQVLTFDSTSQKYVFTTISGSSPDYTEISTNDSNTDVTGAELEELTDGSETTLHSHAGGGGSGDVTGPASSTDNAVTRFDGTTGKTIQNSAVTIDDSGNIATSGTVDGRDVSADGTKLDTIETNADVTDTANVTSAGALMDSEVTNLAQVKAFNSADYATAAQGATADSALQNVVEDTTPQLGGDLDGQSTYDLNNVVNADIEGYIDLGEIATPADPSANTSRIYAVDEGGFTVLHYDDSSGVDLEIGRDTAHVVRNTTGATLTKGQVVYINGSNGTFPTVALADASTIATADVFGLVVADISNNSFGQVIQQGDLSGLDTSSFLDGDTLYLSTTAGALTTTQPTGTDISVAVGKVIKGGSVGGGIIEVSISTVNDPGSTQTLTNKTIDADNNTITNIALGAEATGALTDLSDVDTDKSKTPADGDVLTFDGTDWNAETPSGGGSGDVVGPASATDNAIVRYDGTTGKLIQNSGVTIADSGLLNMGGNNISSAGSISATSLSATSSVSAPTIRSTGTAIEANELTNYSGTDVTLNPDGNLIVSLPEGAGVNKLSVQDNVAAEVMAVDSNGNITTAGTVDGRDVAADGTKLDGIESGADVTDTASVTAAGALMDSEVDADIKTLSLPASTTISTFGASLVDDADAATARTTLGVDAAGTDNSTDVTLAGTPDYITITGQTITRNQIDLTTDVTGDLPITEGGTGASTASAARTNLGLGTISTQAANNVSITGGSITGITDLAIADGGTGASTASAARTNLGLGSLATLSTVNNSNWSGTDLSVANGGTGASTASAARTNLGVADSDLIDLIYPVGSIYIETTGTNPNTTFGVGTWTAFGSGRVPVGYDSGDTDFDTAEETGGSKTHTLTSAEIPEVEVAGINSGTTARLTTGGYTLPSAGSFNLVINGSSPADELRVNGGGGAHNNVQPYIVVHMWKRTA